jgi:polysaccharide export outer membrane protein
MVLKICWLICLFALALSGSAVRVAAADRVAAAPAATTAGNAASKTYVLSPNDLVLMKVYQEDDLETRARIAKDGTATFPLIGVVRLGGLTVEQAAAHIRELFDKDFLVNPQVTLTVVEYSKRRFTVLGQVQKPGAYEIPNEETMTLLQAIAMAGGYSRLANPSRITVTRAIGERRITISLDGKAMAKDQSKPFEILPDDTITVDERVF